MARTRTRPCQRLTSQEDEVTPRHVPGDEDPTCEKRGRSWEEVGEGLPWSSG